MNAFTSSTKVFHCFVLLFLTKGKRCGDYCSAHRCLIIQMKHETHHEQIHSLLYTVVEYSNGEGK